MPWVVAAVRQMSGFERLEGLIARMTGRRKDQVCPKQRGPENPILEGSASTAALALRNHPVDVSHANPRLVDRDGPLGVVLRFRPGHVNAERTEVDVFDVECLVDAVAIRNGWDRAANPRLDVHV